MLDISGQRLVQNLARDEKGFFFHKKVQRLLHTKSQIYAFILLDMSIYIRHDTKV